MTSLLGVYWSVMHRRPQDYDFFKRLQPSVFKIMDGGQNDYAWARENLPGSLIIARDWALSEQHDDMLRDPTGTGRRHAEEWDKHQQRLGFDRANTLILGVNEPQVWRPGMADALRTYTIAMCDRATELGLRVGAMQFSVGWPGNDGPDTPPHWPRWPGVEDAIQRNKGALVAHEYFADQGPKENWGWWCGRVLKCPWQVPIVIGECGSDMYVKDGNVAHHSRGWRGRIAPERYARELAEYAALMSADPRFVGCAVFAADHASQDWYSFDIEPAYQAILATPVPQAPTTTHIPTVSPGTPPTQPAPVPTTLYVAAQDGLNVRLQPGKHSKVLGAVAFGAPVQVDITDNSTGEKWVHVRAGNLDGWMLASYLSPLPPNVVNVPAPQPPAQLPSGIIDPLTALAFMQVESGNRAFENGLLVIRFEVHVFKARLKNDALFDKHFKFTPGNYNEQYWRASPDGAWIHAHGSQADRHALLRFARSLNDTAALRSTGMGLGQVMGDNHARIGYTSPQAMFKAFSNLDFGGTAQLMGFVNYVLSDAKMLDALRRRDWFAAVQGYNGTGQEHIYVPALEKALEKIRKAVGT